MHHTAFRLAPMTSFFVYDWQISTIIKSGRDGTAKCRKNRPNRIKKSINSVAEVEVVPAAIAPKGKSAKHYDLLRLGFYGKVLQSVSFSLIFLTATNLLPVVTAPRFRLYRPRMHESETEMWTSISFKGPDELLEDDDVVSMDIIVESRPGSPSSGYLVCQARGTLTAWYHSDKSD